MYWEHLDGEEGETPETPDTPEEEPEEPAVEEPATSVEDQTRGALAELLSGEMPPWLKANAEIESQRPVTAEELAALPPEAQRVLGQIRKMRDDAAGPLTAEARDREQLLAQKEQELAARERLLLKRAADPLAWVSNPKLKAYLEANAPAGEAPDDPYSPEGQAHAAQVQFQKLIGGFLETLGQSSEDLVREHQQAEADAAAAAQKEADRKYADEHVETLEDPDVYDATLTLMKRGVPFQEAHQFALGKVNATRQLTEEQTLQQQAVALARARLTAGGRLPDSRAATPKELYSDKERLNEHWERNPDIIDRDIEELRKRGAY